MQSSFLRGGRHGIVPPAGRLRAGVKTTGSDHDPANEAQNHDGERKCSEVRTRAERQAGILLIEMKQNGQRERQGGDLKSKSRGTASMDLGISRDQSSKWYWDRGPHLALGYHGIDCRASRREKGKTVERQK